MAVVFIWGVTYTTGSPNNTVVPVRYGTVRYRGRVRMGMVTVPYVTVRYRTVPYRTLPPVRHRYRTVVPYQVPNSYLSGT